MNRRLETGAKGRAAAVGASPALGTLLVTLLHLVERNPLVDAHVLR
jgi:hypothetical protein